MVLGSLLNDVAVCHDNMCSMQDMCGYPYASIVAMIQACNETIPISTNGCSSFWMAWIYRKGIS